MAKKNLIATAKELGWSSIELAQAFDLSIRGLYKVNANPKRIHWLALCALLDMTPESPGLEKDDDQAAA